MPSLVITGGWDSLETFDSVLQYDPPPPKAGEDGVEPPPLSAKEKARHARQLLVTRVNKLYGAAVTEMSQGFALRRRRKESGKMERHTARMDTEAKPTLAEWFKLKKQ